MLQRSYQSASRGPNVQVNGQWRCILVVPGEKKLLLMLLKMRLER